MPGPLLYVSSSCFGDFSPWVANKEGGGVGGESHARRGWQGKQVAVPLLDPACRSQASGRAEAYGKRVGWGGPYHFHHSAISLLACQALSPGMQLEKYAQHGVQGKKLHPLVKTMSFVIGLLSWDRAVPPGPAP